MAMVIVAVKLPTADLAQHDQASPDNRGPRDLHGCSAHEAQFLFAGLSRQRKHRPPTL